MQNIILPNIVLPSFEVCLVGMDKQTSTTLPELIEQSKLGLVLYFYPKDNTQGCTTQALEFSQLADDFAQKGYLVVGVSRDGVKSHQNFIAKHALTIRLISDTNQALCQHFDVIKEKQMYGKTHLGIVRSSFVFDKNGQLISHFDKVKAKGHASELLGTLP